MFSVAGRVAGRFIIVLMIDVATAATIACEAWPCALRLAAAAVVLALETVAPRILTSTSPVLPSRRVATVPKI